MIIAHIRLVAVISLVFVAFSLSRASFLSDVFLFIFIGVSLPDLSCLLIQYS